jgi:hypothetical protein
MSEVLKAVGACYEALIHTTCLLQVCQESTNRQALQTVVDKYAGRLYYLTAVSKAWEVMERRMAQHKYDVSRRIESEHVSNITMMKRELGMGGDETQRNASKLDGQSRYAKSYEIRIRREEIGTAEN